jgi:hypothetical protein
VTTWGVRDGVEMLREALIASGTSAAALDAALEERRAAVHAAGMARLRELVGEAEAARLETLLRDFQGPSH